MKNTNITLQNQEGEIITINNQTLMSMITKQIKEVLKEEEFDLEQIEFLDTLLGFCRK